VGQVLVGTLGVGRIIFFLFVLVELWDNEKQSHLRDRLQQAWPTRAIVPSAPKRAVQEMVLRQQ
jgi:hypothetical protein